MAKPKKKQDECDPQGGVVVPVVDRNRCQDEDLCVAVCPYEVFRIQVLSPTERKSLSFFGKIKALTNSYRQAFVVQPRQCHNCGTCVDACPEDAIQLVSANITGHASN